MRSRIARRGSVTRWPCWLRWARMFSTHDIAYSLVCRYLCGLSLIKGIVCMYPGYRFAGIEALFSKDCRMLIAYGSHYSMGNAQNVILCGWLLAVVECGQKQVLANEGLCTIDASAALA